MNKMQYFLKKHSSTILTVASSAGVITTAVLSVKATPKALILLEEAKKEKSDELSVFETVKVAWKPYIPAAISGVSTIACIFGINYLSIKNQASLMSAYALLDNSYKEYRNKVNEIYEDGADIKVRQEIASSKYDKNKKVEDGKILFFDFNGVRFFESTMEQVMYAENAFLEILNGRGYACINEYYDLLGLSHIDGGDQLGWTALEDNDPYDCHELEFMYEKVLLKGNTECYIIDTNNPLSADYII